MADVAYWSRGVEQVPYVTGAARVMDCADLIHVFDALGVPLPLRQSVLDVGCGTGRLAQLVAPGAAWQGVDVTEDCVAYNAAQGRACALIAAPEDLHVVCGMAGIYDLACALSVFTHIDRAERRRYLQVLQALSSRLVVDILPGEECGDVALWQANVADFEADCAAEDWTVGAVASLVQLSVYQPAGQTLGVLHRYYRLEGL